MNGRIAAERLDRLQLDAENMNSGPHQSFLSEVLSVLTAPRAPQDAGWRALRLLVAMWDTPYARRPEQQAALNDVGQWLEGRLRAQPPLDVQMLATEVGWLRRLARYQGRLRTQGQTQERQRSGAGRLFGHALPKEERRPAPPRARALPTQVEPEAEVAQGVVTLQKNDGSLRARLEGGPDAWARGEATQSLLSQLSEETRTRLRKGYSVSLRVSYRAEGNSRRLIALDHAV